MHVISTTGLAVCICLVTAVPARAQGNTDSTPQDRLKTGELTITVEGVRNAEGQLILSLFDTAESFLKVPLRKQILSLSGKTEMTYTFSDLPYGVYAVSAIHDENANGKLDTNFLHMPKEGVGVSNNIRPKLGPPRFDKAKFEFAQTQVNMRLTLGY